MAADLRLRQATVADAAAIAAIYAPYVRETDITFESEAPDDAVFAGRIAAVLEAGLPYLVACDGDGAVLGYAYAGRFHPRHAYRFTVEPTVYLARDATGKGRGKALYGAVLTILTELGYAEAIALVTLPNAASEALHLSMGFHRSGTYERSGYKFGRWLDVGLFQKGLVAHCEEQQEPLALGESGLWRSLGAV